MIEGFVFELISHIVGHKGFVEDCDHELEVLVNKRQLTSLRQLFLPQSVLDNHLEKGHSELCV